MITVFPAKRKFIDEVYIKDRFLNSSFEGVKEKAVFTIPKDIIMANYPYPYIIDIDEPYTFPPIIDVFPSNKEKVKVVTTDNDDFASKFFEAYFRSQAIKLKYLFS